MGNTSRKMKFEARKVIAPRPDINDSACDVLPEPVIVCRATGTCVVPKDKQRRNDPDWRLTEDGKADYYSMYLRCRGDKSAQPGSTLYSR